MSKVRFYVLDNINRALTISNTFLSGLGQGAALVAIGEGGHPIIKIVFLEVESIILAVLAYLAHKSSLREVKVKCVTQ